MDRFSDAINTIKSNERIGRAECVLPSTKLIKAALEVMRRESYIKDYKEFSEGHRSLLKVQLSNRINEIGVIKPRYAVGRGDIQKYESRYIPSRDFGILLISTPKGVVTNREAAANGTGGRLLAYVY